MDTDPSPEERKPLLTFAFCSPIDPEDFKAGIRAFFNAKPTLLPAGMKPLQHRVKISEKPGEQTLKQEDAVDQQ